MNTKEAIQAMLNGEKVEQCGFEGVFYIMFNGTHFVLDNGTPYTFGSTEFCYRLYEEPKPKQTVTIEKWLCEMGYVLEATQEYFIINKPNKIKLLDTYEVKL